MHARLRAPFVALTLLWTAAVHAAVGDHVWSRADDCDFYADVDAAGNALAAGSFFGTIDFGGGPLTSGTPFNPDLFIVSFDASGAHRWSASFTPIGSFAFTQIDCAAASPSGELYVGGRVQTGQIDFGGGAIGTNGELFVAKFDANGNHVWSAAFGPGDAFDLHATDTHVVVAGYASGAIDFGGGPLPNAGGADACVALLTSGGAHAFSRTFGSAESDYGRDAVITPTGGVAFLAAFRGAVDFGGGTLTETDFNQDLALVTFDAAGNHVWSTHYPGSFSGGSTVTNSGLAVSAGGDLAFAGTLNGSADFGGGVLTSTSLDAFLVRVSSAGAHAHSANFGGAGIDNAYGVAFDASGNAIVSGTFSTSIDLGGGPIAALGFSDVFAAMYNAAGALVWGAGWGAASSSHYLCDVAAGPGRDDFQLCGAPASGLDFGGGGLTGQAFLARLGGEGGGGTAVPWSGRSSGLELSAAPNPCRGGTILRFVVPAGEHARQFTACSPGPRWSAGVATRRPATSWTVRRACSPAGTTNRRIVPPRHGLGAAESSRPLLRPLHG
ncbi:hypothetical protein K8I85_03025, partial [bacterium]|nr:hypothetical protein [bacterium]